MMPQANLPPASKPSPMAIGGSSLPAAPVKKIVSAQDKAQFLNQLLDKQTSEGLWSAADLSIIEKFKILFGVASLNEDNLKKEIKKLAAKNMDDVLLATICALYIL